MNLTKILIPEKFNSNTIAMLMYSQETLYDAPKVVPGWDDLPEADRYARIDRVQWLLDSLEVLKIVG